MNNDASLSFRSRMENKLRAVFHPLFLEIRDDSVFHKGHLASHADETHFTVTLVSALFEGKPLLARHRDVYRILIEELKDHVHALRLHTLSATEYTHKQQP